LFVKLLNQDTWSSNSSHCFDDYVVKTNFHSTWSQSLLVLLLLFFWVGGVVGVIWASLTSLD